MSDISQRNTNEMSNELKNKIRRERIIEIIETENGRVRYDLNDFYNSKRKINAYYKSPTQFSLKDVTEDDIEASKIKKLKKYCIGFLKTLPTFEDNDKLIDSFILLDIDKVLLNTYFYFLEYQIIRINPSFNRESLNTMTIDKVEELLDFYITKKENEHDNKLQKIMERCKVPNDREQGFKKWWNLF